MQHPNDCIQKYKGQTLMSYQDQINIISKNLDTLPCAAKQCPAPSTVPGSMWSQPVQEMKTRNDDMYVSQDVTVREKTETSAQREHFLSRLQNTHLDKLGDARLHFGLDAPPGPTSARELVEWIKAGKFSFVWDDEEDGDYDEYEERHNPLAGIKWTKKKPDRKGYDAVCEKLQKLFLQTKDAIWAETDFSKMPGLLASFESTTVH